MQYTANSLEEHWMPFSQNKEFKENPRLVVKSEGCYMWDQNGGKILDGSSALFNVACGHGRTEISDAVYATTGNRNDLDPGCADHALDGCRYWSMGARKGYHPKTEKIPGEMTFNNYIRQAELMRQGMLHQAGAPMIYPEQMRPALVS